MSFRQTITGTRYSSAGQYVEGIWQPGATSPIEFEASIQPLRPDEMLTLPEGRRTQQAYKLYTDFALQVAEEATGINSDIVQINGENFEIIAVSPYQSGLINHYKAIAVKT